VSTFENMLLNKKRLFNQSNLWSTIDSKHKSQFVLPTKLNESGPSTVLGLKTRLKTGLFLKTRPPEVKKEFADLDKSGYGHQDD